MEVPEESFHWSSWDSRTCYPRRAFIQGLTDDETAISLGTAALGFSGKAGTAIFITISFVPNLTARTYQRLQTISSLEKWRQAVSVLVSSYLGIACLSPINLFIFTRDFTKRTLEDRSFIFKFKKFRNSFIL